MLCDSPNGDRLWVHVAGGGHIVDGEFWRVSTRPVVGAVPGTPAARDPRDAEIERLRDQLGEVCTALHNQLSDYDECGVFTRDHALYLVRQLGGRVRLRDMTIKAMHEMAKPFGGPDPRDAEIARRQREHNATKALLAEARAEWKRADAEVTRLRGELEQVRPTGYWKGLAERRGRQLDQRDRDERALITERDGKRRELADVTTERDRLRQELDLIGGSANGEFLAAEAAFWHRKYQGLEVAVDALTGTHKKYRNEVPPEPPVGTVFVQERGYTWTRKADGWHCSREGCENCPADWESEVCDRVRVRAGSIRHLPGARATARPVEPRRWVAGDPEPEIDTRVRQAGDSGNGKTYTRQHNGWHTDFDCPADCEKYGGSWSWMTGHTDGLIEVVTSDG